jgi:hypothetical protein
MAVFFEEFYELLIGHHQSVFFHGELGDLEYIPIHSEMQGILSKPYVRVVQYKMEAEIGQVFSHGDCE